MAGITFTVELTEEEARARLAEMVARMERPIGFYKNVGEYLTEEAIPRNFATETAPDGSAWAKLSPVTVRRREARNQVPIRILRASDRLQASIVSQASDDRLVVGTPVPYAAVHQGGAAQGQFGARMGRTKPSEKRPRSQDYFFHLPWGDIPARPFLGLSAEDEVEILRIAEDWLVAE